MGSRVDTTPFSASATTADATINTSAAVPIQAQKEDDPTEPTVAVAEPKDTSGWPERFRLPQLSPLEEQRAKRRH